MRPQVERPLSPQQLGHAAVADVAWRLNVVLTGAFGFMCAFGVARTKSIALPIGLHLGWNLVSYAGFSTGPMGPGLLVPGNGAARLEARGLPSLLLDMVLPLALVAAVCWYLTRAYPGGGAAASLDG